MSDQNNRPARLRYTTTGALAALVAVAAIAGTAALAANPSTKAHGHAAVANGGSMTKTPTAPVPGKTGTPQPGSSQPFLIAVQRLVNDGTITETEGQAVDRDIQIGRLDPQTLSGFTQAQLTALQQTLSNTKRALAQSLH